jgi:4-carboxymuconolactone decarboxylase
MTDYKARGEEVIAKMVDPKMIASFQKSPVAPEINDLLVEHAMGMIWARPGLSRRDRSLLTIGMLIALRAENELRAHIPIGLRNGLTRDELAEILYHATAYAGYPAAMTAHKVALEVVPPE